LFPTLNPTPTTGFAQSANKARSRAVADTSALPEGAPVVGGQLAGLAALAIAFVLTIVRLSIRRRPTSTKATQHNAAAAAHPKETSAAEPAEQHKANEDPPADPPAASADVKPDA
jgi:hypothetical protein